MNKKVSEPARSNGEELRHEILRLKLENETLRDRLKSIEGSRSWRLAQTIKRIYHILKIFKSFPSIEISNHNDEFENTVAIWGSGVNLNSQVEEKYGDHRSGWSYAISALVPLHNERAVYLDSFIERTFSWASSYSVPHEYPWVGFVHTPPIVPEWFPAILKDQHLDNIRKTAKWEVSEPFCKGLFALSKYHAEHLRKTTGLPVSVLYHPTEIPDLQWSVERFERNRNKKIIQVGWWLRNLYAIFELPQSDFIKIFLKPKSEPWFEELMAAEKNQRKKLGKLHESMLDTVQTLSFLPNDDYDRLLAENVVFVNLYDTSANNAVVECMARGTPLLINKLPAVVEYLGEEYPLYYETYEEANEKAQDHSLLFSASEYMKQPERRDKLTGRYFLESLLTSDIYKAINKE